jgi:hypothetical protein
MCIAVILILYFRVFVFLLRKKNVSIFIYLLFIKSSFFVTCLTSSFIVYMFLRLLACISLTNKQWEEKNINWYESKTIYQHMRLMILTIFRSHLGSYFAIPKGIVFGLMSVEIVVSGDINTDNQTLVSGNCYIPTVSSRY